MIFPGVGTFRRRKFPPTETSVASEISVGVRTLRRNQKSPSESETCVGVGNFVGVGYFRRSPDLVGPDLATAPVSVARFSPVEFC